MKKKYRRTEIEIFEFDMADVISTSGEEGDDIGDGTETGGGVPYDPNEE